MQSTQRLRIATRIHFALLRHFDENVEVSDLLKGGSEAREALWVCQASGDPELMRLARAFEEPVADRATAPDSDWGRDSGGFGATGFGATTMYGEFVQDPAPRPSMFGRLGLRPLR